jgi:methylated-DNA-[protein]-cysteine S-methyltransferase
MGGLGMSDYVVYYQSPIGLLEIGSSANAIQTARFVEQARRGKRTHPLIVEAASRLAAYFSGAQRSFDLPLDPEGTPFQRLVWQHLLTIPYGQLVSYQAVARAIGKPRSVRAVGAANGQNPIAIIIPCHRVIGSDNNLVGYGGGLWRKEWLLRHEGALLV